MQTKRQIAAYGGELREVAGTREQVAEAAHEEAAWCYYASRTWSPYFIHGTKTCAFEIVEQLGWMAPDYVIAPPGVGTIILALGVGFTEMRNRGLIPRMPRIVAVQAETCCPLYDTWKSGLKRDAYGATIAEGIAHTDSPRREEVLELIRESEGSVIAVSEKEIEEGIGLLARRGFFVEPTSAVVYPGLQKLLEDTSVSVPKVVVLLTGSGLKSTPAMTACWEL